MSTSPNDNYYLDKVDDVVKFLARYRLSISNRFGLLNALEDDYRIVIPNRNHAKVYTIIYSPIPSPQSLIPNPPNE